MMLSDKTGRCKQVKLNNYVTKRESLKVNINRIVV